MEAGQSVLRRKLTPRLPPGGCAAGLPPIAEPAADRQLSRALVRALDRSLGLIARASLRAHRCATKEELAEHLETEGFVSLLAQSDGPPGLIAFDAAGMGTLIEAMTTATLAPRQPAPRRPTPTDAALLSQVVEALLSERGDEAGRFRVERMVRDLRLLDILIEDGFYDLDLVDFELSAGQVTRRGLLLLALPQPAPPAMADLVAEAAPMPLADTAEADWSAALEAAVLGAPTTLRAVLGRVRMPLCEAMTLKVGSALLLPLSKLEEVEIETIDHRPVGQARLGQYRGMRALRITTPGFGEADGNPLAPSDAPLPPALGAEAG